MPISKATYERVALEDPEGQWELVCGRLRSKPGMATEHNWRRLKSGEYEQSGYHGGLIALTFLPGVTIDLNRLFD